MPGKTKNTRRKPDWLKIRLPHKSNFADVHKIVNRYKLNTICTDGKCPNLGECWDRGTATLMILGNICTRACKFCAVKTGKPLPPDGTEAENVALSAELLKLKHCVLTSVDRDDLPDKGANHWANTVKAIKNRIPEITIECLIPDFDGIPQHIQTVVDAKPDIISHNLETVRRLSPMIRSRASYENSLSVIRYLSNRVKSKSGIMVGMGEHYSEVLDTIDDLRAAGCRVLTIGQYLQPTPKHLPVAEYIRPDVFEQWAEIAKAKGFEQVESKPLVRSSYHAERHV